MLQVNVWIPIVTLSHFIAEEYLEKKKFNEITKQKSEKQKSWQSVEHTRLYFKL